MENQQQIIQQPNQQVSQSKKDVRVSAEAFGAKFQGKREVWRFCTSECQAYLPAYETVTIFHLRDLQAGKRTRIHTDKVKHVQIPHFEGLKLENMIKFAKQYPAAMHALPELQREIDKLPREYVGNVIYTIVGEPFAQWINKCINERHARVQKEEEMIELDPEIAEIYERSQSVSGKWLLVYDDRYHFS